MCADQAPTSLDTIMEAYKRVRQEFTPSPLTYSVFISELVGHDVYIKWDNKLRTGSFKERGVINFLGTLSEEEKKSGVCAASAGNHATALAYYTSKANIPCTIVMPTWTPLVKVQTTKKYNAEVLLHGNSFDEAYAKAEEISKKEKKIFVPGFDDYRIIAGQGTIGIELFEQLNSFDSVVVPIGGGGLISGIAVAVHATDPSVHVIGVQSEYIVKKREATDLSPVPPLPPVSIADGIAVKKIGAKNAPIIKEKVHAIVTVTEQQIADAIIKLLELEKTVVEGAGAAGVAALLAKLVSSQYKRTIVMVCGSNIDSDLLYRLIVRDMAKRNRLLRIVASAPDRPGSLQFVAGLIARVGANVLEINHDRSFSDTPGNVSMSFLLEVRDESHKKMVLEAFNDSGISVEEI